MRFNFFPKDVNFFDLFQRQAECAVTAAAFFKELTAKKGVLSEADYAKMHAIEHQGDEAAHKIIKELNTSFITPFDREDILSLVKELDDVVDMLNTIVSRMVVYKVTGPDKHLVEFAEVIEQSVTSVLCAVKGLKNTKNCAATNEACVEINRLENVGDSMRDHVLAELFENAKDPISVIKWKEIYQDAETVLDICEDVAHVVGSILVKQA
jgi:uncharacterized protein